MALNIVILCGFLWAFISPAAPSCTITANILRDEKTPIIVGGSTTNRNGDLLLNDGDNVYLVCSGSSNYLVNSNIGTWGRVTCYNDAFIFKGYNNNPGINFQQFKCRTRPQSTAWEAGHCDNNAKNILIGFRASPQIAIPKIQVCFDAQTSTTYWTKHVLRTATSSCPVDSKNFKKDFFQLTNIDNIYKHHQDYQKGHLVPKCDFLTPPEEKMTYYYVNSAPQETKFNNGNWRSLETVIRTNAQRVHREFYIYTGTISSYKSLDYTLPVPDFFWKVVIDSKNGEGVAFLGVNDVKHNVNSPCKSECTTIQWLGGTFQQRLSVIQKGQIYCCSIQSLNGIPNIQVPVFTEFKGSLLRFIN